MKAVEARLADFLNGPKQFIIPIYQRTYSWTLKECEALWDDLVRVAKDPKRSGHFIGSVVYVDRGLYSITQVPQLLVIDGQQRLTSILLLLTAVRAAMPDGESSEITPRKLTNYFLLNSDEDGDLRWKLLLTQNDRETLCRLIDGGPLPDEPSRRLVENHRFFVEQLKRSGIAPDVIYRGFKKLLIVDIRLDRTQDNPQAIFESLNSTGKALSQADLIRNYILMGLEPAEQTALYQQFWYPMEQRFEAAEEPEAFDRFMRDFLTLRTGDIPNVRDVYEVFKRFAEGGESGDVRTLVADVATSAEYFARMAFGTEPSKGLQECFAEINELKVDVAYPLLLDMYAAYVAHRFTESEFVGMLRSLESYVFRRAIVGIPTNSLNKTFAEFADHLVAERYVESFQARLLLLDSYRRFPSDDEFVQSFITRDIYALTRRAYLLRKLENHGRKEKVPMSEYTIEHIMPQNPDLSPEWREMLGPDWERIHETYLHTIGNLTLTGYNPELSDRPFLEKRDIQGGFAMSPLVLNQDLRTLAGWTEAEIRARAERLATRATAVWAKPSLTDAVLAGYRPGKTPAETGSYTLADHPHLNGPLLQLFERLQARILALGPGITMVPLKLYIAFKVDTNFVDVVPQSSRLRLTLNMRFDEVHDPRGLCEDVTGLGRWGNGDVILGLGSGDDLDYAMTIVEQAYKRRPGASPS